MNDLFTNYIQSVSSKFSARFSLAHFWWCLDFFIYDERESCECV